MFTPYLAYIKWGAVALLMVVVGVWQHSAGKDAQRASDQSQFDAYNAQITANKAQAAKLLQQAYADNAALDASRSAIKTNLEQEHLKNVQTTNALHTALAGVRLRYIPKNSGSGSGSSDAIGLQPSRSDHADAPAIELPESLASRILAVGYEADQLADDYRLLYNWAHSDALRCK